MISCFVTTGAHVWAQASEISQAGREVLKRSVPQQGVVRVTIQSRATKSTGTTVRAFDFGSGAWVSSGGTVGTGGRRPDGSVFAGSGRPGETKSVPTQLFHRTADAEWADLVPAVAARMLLRDSDLVESENRTEDGGFEFSFRLAGEEYRPLFILTVDASGVPLRFRTAEKTTRAFDKSFVRALGSPDVPLVVTASTDGTSKEITSIEWLPDGTSSDVSEEVGERMSATLRVDDAKSLAAISQGWTKNEQGDWVGPDAHAITTADSNSSWSRWSITVGASGVLVVLVAGAVWWRKRVRL